MSFGSRVEKVLLDRRPEQEHSGFEFRDKKSKAEPVPDYSQSPEDDKLPQASRELVLRLRAHRDRC